MASKYRLKGTAGGVKINQFANELQEEPAFKGERTTETKRRKIVER